MKKFRVMCLLLVALMLTLTVFAACTPDPNVDNLVVYNWADYIYDFEDDFAEYYENLTGKKINVTYVTFDTNETMLTRVMKGGSNVDVVCPSEYAIQKLLEADMLEEINYFTASKFKNSGHVDDDIVEKVRDAFYGLKVGNTPVDITKYFVPYMYGTLGILYNADIMEQNGISKADIENAGWGVLFNKNANGQLLSSSLTKKILMKDSIRDSYAATVFYLLGSGKLDGTIYQTMEINDLINHVDDTLLALVEETLIEQKTQLYGYEVDFGKNELIQGTAYVDLAWSGDAMYAIEEAALEGITLDYFTPSVAGNIWFDGWVIPKTATNKAAAEIFIDFLNSPYVAAQNMAEIGYTSAVAKDEVLNDTDAMQVLLDAYEYSVAEKQDFIDYFFTELRYPTVTDPAFGVMQDFGEHTNTVVLMWGRVRSYGLSTWQLLLYIGIGLIVIIGAVVIVVQVRNKGKKRVRV